LLSANLPAPGQAILTGSATANDDVPRHSGAGRAAMARASQDLICSGTVESSTHAEDLFGGARRSANDNARTELTQ